MDKFTYDPSLGCSRYEYEIAQDALRQQAQRRIKRRQEQEARCAKYRAPTVIDELLAQVAQDCQRRTSRTQTGCAACESK
jgi:hypothetical protein